MGVGVGVGGRRRQAVSSRVGNFRQKKFSAEDGIDGTIGLFRRNSGCSVEKKTLGIPFRTILQKIKQLEIPFHRTKIEANSRNSLPKNFVDENTFSILFAAAGVFVKQIFSCNSVLFRASD